MTKIIAPYGAWVSPVSVELMTEAAIGLSGLHVDGQDIYWLEARPSENGRTVLCRRRADGEILDLTPPPFNVGSRVHEYGGGAYAVAAGVVVASERTDGSVWLVESGAALRRIETPEHCRYADFEFDLPRRRVLAVREDHRSRPPADPKAAIVALPLDPGGAETILIEGPDFLSLTASVARGRHALPGSPGIIRICLGTGRGFSCPEVMHEGALEAPRLVAGPKHRKHSCSRSGRTMARSIFAPTGPGGGTSMRFVAPR